MNRLLSVFAAGVLAAVCSSAQPQEPPADAPEVVPLNENRILKVIPDYQTVEETHGPVAPMTPKQKWNLAWREQVDPFNLANAVLAAAMSQADDETPRYGRGAAAYGKRVGAAIGDFGTQSFLAGGVFACLLHQDPRYFRKGPTYGVVRRVVYSVSRIVVTRQDSGRTAFNASNLLGMAAGIGVSNLYYPAASRTDAVMLSRIGTSLTGDVMGNLMSEFWPDLQKKFFQKKQK